MALFLPPPTPSPPDRGHGDGNRVLLEKEASRPGLRMRWPADVQGRPAGCAGSLLGARELQSGALQRALCLDSLTDLNLNTPRSQGISALRIHHPANIYIPSPSLHLSVWRSYLGLCLFIPPRLESLSLTSPLCFALSSFASPSFSLGPPSTLLSLILSCFSLCLSLPLLLRFNKSPGGRREKTGGGVKTSMALFTKGPGIARR